LPIGVPGEICIGGAGVALGYLGQADETARRFIADRFERRGGGRLYRTGDIGRWGSNGQLYHLGRNDFQVKVRGYRIEPGEIEAALARHPAVEQAVVVAHAVSEAGMRLLAYVVGRDGVEPSGAELRDYLRTDFPPYMVPSVFIPLANVPLTPSGKVDRAALPAPADFDAPRAQVPMDSPRTATEVGVAQVWRQLLNVTTVGATENFLDLGGHSLLIMRAIALLERQFGVRLNPRAFIFQSLQQIAAEIDRSVSAQTPPQSAKHTAGRTGSRLVQRLFKALTLPKDRQ
jgi:acyl carrier protein